MLEERQNRLQKLMQKEDIDCLVLAPGVDMFYTSGVQIKPSERLHAVILPQEGEQQFLCPSFEESRISKVLKNGTTRIWDEDENPFSLLAEILKELNLDKKEIALDNKLWFEWFLKIKNNLPKANFHDCTAIVQKARLTKSPLEIKIMKRASKIAAEAIIAVQEEAEVGMTETDLQEMIQKELSKEKEAEQSFAIIQSGENTAYPHLSSTGKKLQKGEPLLIDAGPVYKGYIGDVTITSVVGNEPSKRFLEIYDIVYEANRTAHKASREGAKAESVDQAARKVINNAGYGDYFTHRLGHGLGLEVHEAPYMVEGNKLVLKEGMCHTIEPGIYIEGEFGIRIEDDVVVRKDQCEFLYEVPRRIWELS
jgi:Xaa-Pro dipeptidase